MSSLTEESAAQWPSPVVITCRSFSQGDLDLVGELRAAGCEVRIGPPSHQPELLHPMLHDAVAWIAGTAAVGARDLEAAPRLRLLARYGVGTDSVDLAAARARGVWVTNTPDVNTEAVADHTIALMLAALRSIPAGDRAVRARSWQAARGRQLGSLTVGIIGVGRIGRAVAGRLRGFGSTVLGYDPAVPTAEFARVGIERVELIDLVRRSAVVTLHAPGERRIVDPALLARMRPGAVLVNTARAALVDEGAVAAALTAGELGCYASDVLGGEHGSHGGNPLLGDELADKTVLTPHAAAATVEAVDGMGRGAVDAVLALVAGRTPDNLVLDRRGAA